MSHNLKISNFSSLSVLEQATCLQLQDLLNRNIDLSLPVYEDTNKKIVVAFDNEKPVGWIRFFPRRLLLHRSANVGLDFFKSAALIEFPVVERFEPYNWEALIEFALGELFQIGASWAGIYLPTESKRHVEFLETLKFVKYADCDNIAFLRTQGYERACGLWMRKCPVARGNRRPDLYPYLDRAGILYTADLTTAPDPSPDFWTQALLYSGYSGYPWLHNILDTFIDKGTKSILSIPCATADLFRLLPAEKINALEFGMGVDIVERSIDFGKIRLKYPHLDIINMLLCHMFFAHKNGTLNISIIDFLKKLCEMTGRSLDTAEAEEYYLQLQAAFMEIVSGGAITDWFILMKGLGRLISLSPKSNIFIEPEKDDDSFRHIINFADKIREENIKEFIHELGKDALFSQDFACGHAAKILFANKKIRLEKQDMFNLSIQRKFDVIFIWEAALMIAGAGKELIFLDKISPHLSRKGRIVFTGIRNQQQQYPRELEIIKKILSERGFDVSLIGIKPRAEDWAYGQVSNVWFPVLIAQSA